jgi:hypothetical protein
MIHARLAPGADGLPGMVIFKTCANLIRTLPSLPYSTTNPEDVAGQHRRLRLRSVEDRVAGTEAGLAHSTVRQTLENVQFHHRVNFPCSVAENMASPI